MANRSSRGSALRALAFVAVSAVLFPSAGFAQPVITARVVPAPNAAGWNNSEVTISFFCRGVRSCPEAVRLSDEAAGLRVTRSITDEAGREATATVIVNIDRTPPSVTISSPADDATTDAPNMIVSAAGRELGSGIRGATCNGRVASVRAFSVSCSVNVEEGVNGVIVQMMDVAGNSGSAGVRVSRTGPPSSATIVPGTATLYQGETRGVQLVDALGRALPRAAWHVNNALIATLQYHGDEVAVRALGPGRVTVTATWGQFTAQARFTVMPGRTLPAGTTKWTLAPLPGFVSANVVYTHPTPEGPEMFTIERATDGRRVLLRAVTSAPAVLWTESPAIREDEEIVDFMGESFGGVLLRMDGADGKSSAIVRAGRPSEGPLWRYESPGILAREFAQGWDGTVYVVETMADGFPHVLGLEGATGLLKFRWPITRSSLRVRAGGCAAGVAHDDPPPIVGNPSVPDGNVAALAFVTVDAIKDDVECGRGVPRVVRTLHLARITASGKVDVLPLNALSGVSEAEGSVITPLGVVPNYFEAVLVPWIMTAPDGRIENWITRVHGDHITAYTLPFLGDVGIGDDTAYTVTADGRTLVVFDPVSGRVRYVRHASTGTISVIAVAKAGNVIVHSTGPLLDENYQPAPVSPKQ